MLGVAQAQDSNQPAPYDVRYSHWTSPYAIDARPGSQGVYLTGGEHFSAFEGRKMQMKEWFLGGWITDSINVFYGRQNYHLEGRSQTSRFNVNSEIYGGKWIVRKPDEDGDVGFALEVQFMKPGSATATTGHASEIFSGTKNQMYAVDLGANHGLQYQLAYNSVSVGSTGSAYDYTLGASWDHDLSSRAQLKLQAQLAIQQYTDVVDYWTTNFRPVLTAFAGYDANKFLRFEGDATLFPSGMPYASGPYTSLSSFEIYRPGGVAGDIRTNTIGFASLRVLLHWSY